jgi:hypothetical protein
VQHAEWLGRVVVVAGDRPVLAEVAAQLVAAGAFVATVSTLIRVPTAQLSFRADPGDAQVWQRVAPHVEQHLGPVDAVVTDDIRQQLLEEVFGADLRRRGHGAVIGVAPQETPGAVFSRLGGTR